MPRPWSALAHSRCATRRLRDGAAKVVTKVVLCCVLRHCTSFILSALTVTLVQSLCTLITRIINQAP